MSQPVAYSNGRFVPASEVSISVSDQGFLMGVTVTERVRTFGGVLFRLDEHLDRLAQSLDTVGIRPGLSRDELAEVAGELVARNHPLLAEGDDLGLVVFATPGISPSGPSGAATPTVCMHTLPLPMDLWADKYDAGQTMVTSRFRQIPAACWPPHLKCRSRMHYYLADREAQAAEPQARALILDVEGLVCEASTANVVAYFRDRGLVSPLREKILLGISLAVLGELAQGLGVDLTYRDLTPAELAAADEVMLCSTSPCLLPVVRVDGRPIGDGRPGETYRSLLAAWSEVAGLDIAGQAKRFARR